MKLPRDLSGEDLATLLRRRYGYHLVRQKGSHMTLTATLRGVSHNVTVPRHRVIRVGTLSGILSDVATHLAMPRAAVQVDLFGS